MILELIKIKSLTGSIVSPSTCDEVMGMDAMIFVLILFLFLLHFALQYCLGFAIH